MSDDSIRVQCTLMLCANDYALWRDTDPLAEYPYYVTKCNANGTPPHPTRLCPSYTSLASALKLGMKIDLDPVIENFMREAELAVTEYSRRAAQATQEAEAAVRTVRELALTILQPLIGAKYSLVATECNNDIGDYIDPEGGDGNAGA